MGWSEGTCSLGKGMAEKETILVIDEEPSIRKCLQTLFELDGFSVHTVASGEEALERIGRGERPDIITLCVLLVGMDGIETLRRLKTVAPDLPVVMITVDTDLAAAVQATKLGAYDFLLRPVDEERLLLTIRHALERSSLRDQVENLRHIVGQGGYLSKLVLPSSSMRAIVEQIANVAV